VPLSPLRGCRPYCPRHASHSRRQRDLARGSGVGRLQQRSPWPPARFPLPPAGRPTASPATHPRHGALVALGAHTHPAGMMVVTEAEVAVIAPSEQRGEFSAAVELRRLFPAITDTAQARACPDHCRAGSPCPTGRARCRGRDREARYHPTGLIAALLTKAWRGKQRLRVLATSSLPARICPGRVRRA
jgi:hypothetical protein